MKILKSKVLPAILSMSIFILGIGPIGASAASQTPISASTATAKIMKDTVDEEAVLKTFASILRAGGWLLEKALSRAIKQISC